jgi:chromosomal replication initiator protein
LNLAARDEFVRDWIRAHFQPALVEALSELSGSPVEVTWRITSEIRWPLAQVPSRSTQRPGLPPNPSLPFPPDPAQASWGFDADGQSELLGEEPRRPHRLKIGERADSLTSPLALSSSSPPPPNTPTSHSVPPPSGRYGQDGPRSSPPRSYAPRVAASAAGSSSPPSVPPAPPSSIPRATTHEQLNPKFTFANFVVGPSNELAHAAAFAAAGLGGPRYNPLFICGGTGLGKTHLMHSIAHQILDSRPNACVLYISAERFTNQFIEALQHHKMEEFRQRYRTECDLLLVDDIQFLAGREQTQEEFFHTFNALHEADKPIVVSSDKYPQDLQRMPERLISRFTSGLVADIQTPALETRVAIVRAKAQLEGIQLDDDVAVLLAQHVKSNVRELEGTLIRLAAKSSLIGRAIDFAFAEAEVAMVSPRRPDPRTVEDIQRAVCGHFRLTNSELLSKDRHKSVAFARQVAMYLCRQRLKSSFPELGRAFGNRDHTTVMSAVRRVEALRRSDPEVDAHLQAIETKLGSSE